MNKKRPGFTLVEIMVALGIIAVLVGISFFAIGAVQESRRNTQRSAKLNDIVIGINKFSQNFGEPDEIVFSANEITIRDGSDSVTIELDGVTEAEFSGGTTLSLAFDTQGTTSTGNSPSGKSIYCFAGQGGSAYIIGVKLEGGGEAVLDTDGGSANDTCF